MTPPPGVILAGGRASRMGGSDKALLHLGGKTLLARVLDRLARQVADMAISANGDPDRFAAFGLPVLPDSVSGFPGPLAGVLAGLDWAAEFGADRIVTVAADTPFLPRIFVAQLERSAAGMRRPLVIAATRDRVGRARRHPTAALWPVGLRGDLRAALAKGTRKVTDWADAHEARSAMFEADNAFFNVNTPEDLRAAEAMLDAGRRRTGE